MFKRFGLTLMTLIVLALPSLSMAQLAPELVGKDGFPKPELLDAGIRASHCYYLPVGWASNMTGVSWVSEEATSIYAPDFTTCISFIRLGIVGHSTLGGTTQISQPGTVFYDDHKGRRGKCDILKVDKTLPIPEVVLKSYGELIRQNRETGPTDQLKEMINFLMSQPEVVNFLDEIMPLQCLMIS